MSATWTLVSKPQESSVVTSIQVSGSSAQPFGLLMAITSVVAEGTPTTSITGTSVTSGWTNITKPTSSTWTLVGKPST